MPCSYDPAGRITAITQHLWASVTTGGSTTLATTPLHWQIGYDSRNRLSSFTRQGAETRYTYDANSNRLTATDKLTSDTDLDGQFDSEDFTQTTSQQLAIEGTSNRLLGMQQTITRQRDGRTRSTASTTVNYAIDANGALVSDGLRTFEYDEANRLAKVRITRDGEAASVRYLSNAMSQRVFKGEPTSDATLPDEQELGEGFIAWLRKNFRWMFERAQASTSIGTAYLYADGDLPQWALLGEYDNGSAAARGRSEYIWLPTGDGAIPIGMLRGGQFYAIHTDHLGTSRLMTNAENKPVWQWPYSAFGNNKPTGVLQATANPKAAITNQPVLLRATNPQQALDFRFPGQHFDDATQMADNIHRTYWMLHGRYSQADPIGTAGGWNRFAYASASTLTSADPLGLFDFGNSSQTLQRFVPVAQAATKSNLVTAVGSTAFGFGMAAYAATHSDDEDCCGEKLANVYAAMKEVETRLADLYFDELNLKGLAPCRPSPSLPKNSGSWNGHIEQLEGQQRRLIKAINEALAAKCKVPPFAWRLAFAKGPPRMPCP